MNSFNSNSSCCLVSNIYQSLPYTATGTYTRNTYGIYTILTYTGGTGTFNESRVYSSRGGECWFS